MEWFPNGAGGLARYFYEAVHALPSVGVSGSAILTSIEPGQKAPMALFGMAAKDASLTDRLKGSRRLVRTLLPAADLLNSHFALYTYPALRCLGSKPLVVNFHGPWADEMLAEAGSLPHRLRARVARRIECAVYRRADRVITLSKSFREVITNRYGVDENRVQVVPGGVDLRPYLAAPERSVAREKLGWPGDRPILLSIRRLARRMGLESLIDAMEEVRKSVPGALLLIGGKGSLAHELQARIDSKGLQENVRLLGFVPDDDLPACYAAADLMVVPTVALEGFGLVTVESLASGTPVLGTRVGGTPEILEPLEPALLFDSPSPDAIAARITDALSGRFTLPSREDCREYSRRFGWEEVAPKIRAVFEDAKSQRR